MLFSECFCSERAGLLPCQKQQAESVISLRLENPAGLVHRIDLPLGVASATARHRSERLVEGRRNIWRYCVHMGTEHHLRLTPGEKKIGSAIPHLKAFHSASLSRKPLLKKVRQRSLLTRSRIDI